MGRRLKKIGQFAKKALTWIGIALGVLDKVPSGLVDPRLYSKVMGILTKMFKLLTKAEETVGAHTKFWPTLDKAPKTATLVIIYPDGTEEILHPMTVEYLKLFKKAFDEIKKLK